MPKSQNIRVLCRVRPENTKEKLSGHHPCLSCPSPTEIEITSIDLQVSPLKFTFDQVFPSTSLQHQIFDYAAKPLLNEVFEGINCTLFCYGQTSSGKTFTMEGISNDVSLKGIIPRAMLFIFYMYAHAFQEKPTNEPVWDVPASVVSKEVISGTHSSGRSQMGYSFLLRFQTDDGQILELYAYEEEFGGLREGMTGILTYQGRYFVDFK